MQPGGGLVGAVRKEGGGDGGDDAEFAVAAVTLGKQQGRGGEVRAAGQGPPLPLGDPLDEFPVAVPLAVVADDASVVLLHQGGDRRTVEIAESGLVGEGEPGRAKAFEQPPQCHRAPVVEGREHGQFVDGPLRQLIDDRRAQTADDADL